MDALDLVAELDLDEPADVDHGAGRREQRRRTPVSGAAAGQLAPLSTAPTPRRRSLWSSRVRRWWTARRARAGAAGPTRRRPATHVTVATRCARNLIRAARAGLASGSRRRARTRSPLARHGCVVFARTAHDRRPGPAGCAVTHPSVLRPGPSGVDRAVRAGAAPSGVDLAARTGGGGAAAVRCGGERSVRRWCPSKVLPHLGERSVRPGQSRVWLERGVAVVLVKGSFAVWNPLIGPTSPSAGRRPGGAAGPSGQNSGEGSPRAGSVAV